MIITNYFQLFLTIIFITWTTAILRCGMIRREQNKNFYRVKKCYRRNASIIARGNFNSYTKCLSFALEKKGLAFNYSPKKDSSTEDDFFFSNCEILGCPDTDNLSLINDTRFDYYTLYGNTESLMNASCVPSIGIFQLSVEHENFTKAENVCKSLGGELADILSESRTNGLAQIIATRTSEWYKAAYVGLNDQLSEGVYITPKDEPLDCFEFRAWAPGHPRPRRKKDDCVILDAEKTWRAIHCAKKMLYLCEIVPQQPYWMEMQEFVNGTCRDIRNRTIRRRCKKITKKFKKAKKPVNYEDEMEYEDRCEDD